LIGARNGDRVVRVLEDVVLGTITEVVKVGIDRWREGTLVHLVAGVKTGSGS